MDISLLLQLIINIALTNVITTSHTVENMMLVEPTPKHKTMSVEYNSDSKYPFPDDGIYICMRPDLVYELLIQNSYYSHIYMLTKLNLTF